MEKVIGERIQEFRKKRKVTQEQLAEAIGITPHYLSALERGLYNIKLDTLVKILNYLDCSADEVFYGVVNKSFATTSNKLSERIALLPVEEQSKILAVLDIMINNATNSFIKQG